MRIPIIVPKATLSMEQATILRWMKASGEPVQEEDVLLELETDKVVIDIPAPAAGILEIGVASGEVGVEQTIGWISNGIPAGDEAKTTEPPAPPPERSENNTAVAPRPGSGPPQPVGVVATPAAKRRARELGLALEEIKGSGPGGRITEE